MTIILVLMTISALWMMYMFKNAPLLDEECDIDPDNDNDNLF